LNTLCAPLSKVFRVKTHDRGIENKK